MASLLSQLRERAAGLRRDLADGQAAAVYLRQLLRGNRSPHAHAAPGPGLREAPATPPVLLIHGYLATRGSLHLLEKRLHEREHVVMSYRLGGMLSAGFNIGDIRDSAGLIARKVESIVAQTGVPRVDVVGHSMGGLVGLYYVKRLGGRHRVRRLVLLGTPARGTLAAVLGLPMAPLGRGGLQLLPGSPFLRELAETPMPAGVDVVTIAGERDWFAPLGSTVLAGIRHVALPAGHSGLLVDADVAAAVAKALRAPMPTTCGPAPVVDGSTQGR